MTTVTLGAIDMSNYVDYDGIEKIKSKQIVESTFPAYPPEIGIWLLPEVCGLRHHPGFVR